MSKGKAPQKPSKLDDRISPVVDPLPSEHTPLPSPPPFASLAIENALMPEEPAIYDPGNGPRVKNIHAFLASSFSSPPSLDDDLCAEFAQEEMLDMLCTVLSDELALVSLPPRCYTQIHYVCIQVTRLIVLIYKSVCGIIRAARCRGYVHVVQGSTDWAIYCLICCNYGVCKNNSSSHILCHE